MISLQLLLVLKELLRSYVSEGLRRKVGSHPLTRTIVMIIMR